MEPVEAVGSDMPHEVMTLRNVGFRLLYETGQPVEVGTLAFRSGFSTLEIEEILAMPDLIGRAKRDETGRLVGIAGLTIEPTRHEITIEERRFWTWCALDAVGIFSALGLSGQVLTTPPDGSDPITIEFVDGVSVTNESLFLADGFDASNSVETWCPHVNFFPDSETANTWANQKNLDGNVVTISEVAEAAEQVWKPVVMTL